MNNAIMRRTTATALLLILCGSACGDDDTTEDNKPGMHDAGVDGGSKTPAASAKLPRPELPRPPTKGLPAELRPPR